MERLPREVICHIACFLEREDEQSGIPLSYRKKQPSKLPPFATISREWQYAIERRTFRSIHLRSTDIDEFEAICVGHRRSALVRLALEVILPTYSDKACARFERKHDKRANDEAFKQAIEKLFRVLKSWEGHGDIVPVRGGQLHFFLGEVYSPMDGYHRGAEKYEHEKNQRDFGRRHDLFEHRYEHSLIHLLHPDDLSTISRVSRFEVAQAVSRKVDMRTVVDIAVKFSNLQDIHWTLHDNEKRYPGLRRRTRHSFAEGIQAYSFPSLKAADITFYHEAPMNHSTRPANVVSPPPQSCDPLSTALRKLAQSQNLTSLLLKGVIDPCFFWPEQSTTLQDKQLNWPRLEKLHVTFDITNPSGNWYFVDPDNPHDELSNAGNGTTSGSHDDEEDSDNDTNNEAISPAPSDQPDNFDEARETTLSGMEPVNFFRSTPNPQTLPPLLEAMARAAARMPKLREMSLSTYLDATGTEWAVSYYAPGQKMFLDQGEEEDLGKRRVYWEVGEWRPDGQLQSLWERVDEESGVEIVQRFL